MRSIRFFRNFIGSAVFLIFLGMFNILSLNNIHAQSPSFPYPETGKKLNPKIYSPYYMFGFNRKDKLNKQYGDGKEKDFETKMYNHHMCRWMSVDPLQQSYPSISPYAFSLNNPICFRDPDGKKVINGWTAIRQTQEIEVQKHIDNLADMEKSFGSIHKRKDFTGTSKDWNAVKKEKRALKESQVILKDYKDLETETDNIINEWKTKSPNVFYEADNATNSICEPVDMIVFAKNLVDYDSDGKVTWKFNDKKEAIGGYNQMPNFVQTTFGGDYKPLTRPTGLNTIHVYIEKDWRDRDTFQKQNGGNIINHETGHFLVLAENSYLMAKYLDQLQKEKRDLNGGHNSDDESGKKAKEYEKRTD